jgi:group I intron endonuclease
MLIYRVTNVNNGKIYIGKTKQTLEKRKRSHLKKSRHKAVDKMTFFHRAIRKYGSGNFHWDIIETLSNGTDEELCQRECYYIKQYDSNHREKGYNLTEGGEGVRRSGWKHHEETKDKIGNSNRGRCRTKDQKLRIKKATIEAMKSHPRTEDQLKRMILNRNIRINSWAHMVLLSLNKGLDKTAKEIVLEINRDKNSPIQLAIYRLFKMKRIERKNSKYTITDKGLEALNRLN